MTDSNDYTVSGRAGAAPSSPGRGLETPAGYVPGPAGNSRIVRIFGPTGAAGFGIADLAEALANQPGPAVLEIHSDGGDARSGFALARRIHEAGLVTYAHAASSAAVLPLIAGRHRTLAKNGWIGIHPTWEATAGGWVELEATARALRAIDQLLCEALARWSNLSTRDAARAIATGRVFDPQEALAAGLIDRIGPASARVTERPARLVDGPGRQVAVLEDEAEHHHRIAAHRRASREAREANEIRPDCLDINRQNQAAAVWQFAARGDRLASVYEAAAGDILRHDQSTPRWRCNYCGAANFQPPATGIDAAACFTCNHPTEDEK